MKKNWSRHFGKVVAHFKDADGNELETVLLGDERGDLFTDEGLHGLLIDRGFKLRPQHELDKIKEEVVRREEVKRMKEEKERIRVEEKKRKRKRNEQYRAFKVAVIDPAEKLKRNGDNGKEEEKGSGFRRDEL